jgi:uncharacterized protein YjbI with pentapeptide repeats
VRPLSIPKESFEKYYGLAGERPAKRTTKHLSLLSCCTVSFSPFTRANATRANATRANVTRTNATRANATRANATRANATRTNTANLRHEN